MNLKRIILTLSAIFIMLPAFSMTMDEARDFAFNKTETTLYMPLFRDYLYDVYCSTHLRSALSNGTARFCDQTPKGYEEGRVVIFYFLDDIDYYTLQYDNHPGFLFGYNYRGYLKWIAVINPNSAYPNKWVKYDEKGELMRVQVFVSELESYIFDEDKKMITHWIGNKAYNDKNKRIKMFPQEF